MKIKVLILFTCLLSLPVYALDPEVKSGDMIFQTSKSKQSSAIMWASKSLYSHVGVIEVVGKKKYVIEAISKVSRTPLEKWIQRGRLGRYAVYRYDGISEQQQKSVVANATKYLGTGYDIFFTSRNKEIYCSELVSLAFKRSGLSVGKYEKVKDLDVDNFVVRRLVEKRWRKHPLCRSGIKKFEDCWAKILEDELVTPESVAIDAHLKKIFSNYP